MENELKKKLCRDLSQFGIVGIRAEAAIDKIEAENLIQPGRNMQTLEPEHHFHKRVDEGEFQKDFVRKNKFLIDGKEMSPMQMLDLPNDYD